MVKHTQTIRLQQSTICLSVFDHFVGLARKQLNSATQVVNVRQEQSITITFELYNILASNKNVIHCFCKPFVRDQLLKTVKK